MNAIVKSLLRRRLLVFTGKGGVGKSAVAGTIAILAAQTGKRVLLIEADTKSETRSVFRELFSLSEGLEGPLEVRPGLWHLHIDPDIALEAFVVDKVRIRSLYLGLKASSTFRRSLSFFPGVKELLILYKIWLLQEERTKDRSSYRWDLIVYDAPPTGQGVFFLKLPHVGMRILHLSPLAKDMRKLAKLFQDPLTTSVNIVTLAQELPVNETIDLHREMAEIGISPGAIFANAVFPEVFSPTERGFLAEPGGDAELRAALGQALAPAEIERVVLVGRAQMRWRQANESHLSLLYGRGWPIVELPYIYRRTFDVYALEDLARFLSGEEVRIVTS